MNSRVYKDAMVMTLDRPIDFSVGPTWILDLTAKLSTANPPLQNGLQSLYVDASFMDWGPVDITISGSAQTPQVINVLPNTQGYFPIIVQSNGPLVIQFNNPYRPLIPLAGQNLSLKVSLMNIPMVQRTWNTLGNLPLVMGTDNGKHPQLVADLVMSQDFINPPASGSVLLTGNPNYYISSISGSFDPTSGGGNNLINFTDDQQVGPVWSFRFSFPMARPAGPATGGDIVSFCTPPNFFFRNLVPLTSFRWNSFAPILGAITINLNYGKFFSSW